MAGSDPAPDPSPSSFAIVIPTYRRAPLLRRLLPSYLRTAAGEIVLVDDASGPPHHGLLADLAARHPRVRLLTMPRHQGQPAAKNLAVERCAAEWIVFGEDDVWFPPEYPETLIEHARAAGALVASGGVPLVHPRVLAGTPEEVDRAVRAAEMRRRPVDRFLGIDWPVEGLPNGDLATPHLPACAAVHRSVFDRVRFDTRYRGNAFREETDFFVSCERAGIRTVYCRHAACGHMKEHTRAVAGGSWAAGRTRYAVDLVANNRRFVRKHRAYLAAVHERVGRPDGPVRMQARFLLELLGRIRPTSA